MSAPPPQQQASNNDEWTFSIRVPSEEEEEEPQRKIGLTRSSTTTTRLIELKQEYPHSDSNKAMRNNRDRQEGGGESSEDNNSQGREEIEALLTDIEDDEVVLDDEDDYGIRLTSLREPDSTLTLESGGWAFHSPFWNLLAGDLLRVTYFPAWQALPEYSNSNCPKGGMLSCCGSCCCSTNQVDYSSYTYTAAADTVHVENIPAYEIQGIGKCQAVRLHLRPLTPVGEYYHSIPSHLQQAWQAKLAQIRENRISRGLHPETAGSAENGDNHDDGDGNSSNSHLKNPEFGGPIITFALPSSQVDPPLLWNVQFPAISERQPIALETLTVLDGALLCGGGRGGDQHISRPTHIFINGYQSWSFAGSIPRGQVQPTSAMPNLFSRAFNYGGSVPPPADSSSTYLGASSTTSLPALTRPNHLSPLQVQYTSDFFTCITSDGLVPEASRLDKISSTIGMDKISSTIGLDKLSSTGQQRRAMRASSHATALPPYQQLDETGGPALLLGWLSQRKQFGVVTADKDLKRFQMHASCHGQLLVKGYNDVIVTDWAYAQLISNHSYDEEPMVHFLHDVASRNKARPLQNGSLLTGWCSWYFAYERISAKLLRENFATLAGLKRNVPTNVSVVDDGYMTAWGDWDSVKSRQFPDGMEVVSKDISEHGMRPGLWMAPFAADKHSKLAALNPDWIIGNHAGAAANSANCGKFFYGLDATNPNVREYVHHCVRRAVENWGFNVLKIDFLYAACLEGNGKFDLSMSRAEAMDLALNTIRDAAGPDVFLIGCGCPIASGIGFVDAMRISADTGPTWYPPPPLPWWDMGTLPSLRSMVRNSISRAPFGHRWWHNDPDCLMVGEHTRLTNDEVASAASVVAMTCGMLLLSDDLPKVPDSRKLILSKIFPMTGVSAVVLDLHSTNNGLPSLLRLWCTDKYNVLDKLRKQLSNDTISSSDEAFDHNAEATFLARQASFRPNEKLASPEERSRSCIHVTKGLGTWTVLSISNWLDKPDVVHIPPPALLPPPSSGWGIDSEEGSLGSGEDDNRDYGEHGYHVFAFWSSRYSWLAPFSHDEELGHEHTISKKLGPHATEIFHIKPVTPDAPQYIGSDLHFSCGRELRAFRGARDHMTIRLNTDYKRAGRIFVFIPRVSTDNVRVAVNGEPVRWTAMGNTPKVNENGSPRLLGRIIAIPVVVRADESSRDGHVHIDF